MRLIPILLAVIWAGALAAQDVFVIGEVHDNPAHHRYQAEKTARIAPRAIVFEMITATQAENIRPDMLLSPDALEQALNWNDSGWPDFAMYAPIFSAAPEARIYGAYVPGKGSPHLRSKALSKLFKKITLMYRLNRPLPPGEQKRRSALQMAAHCNALPKSALPALIEAQRLRDAVLAETARQAILDTGGPVVVITGNGHARTDWGMPALLAWKAPDLDIVAIGQTEGDHPLDGKFDQIVSAPALDRPDPCLVFRQGAAALVTPVVPQ